MSGVDPSAHLQQVAGRLDSLGDHRSAQRALDGLEYLYRVMAPEPQPLADAPPARPREPLAESA